MLRTSFKSTAGTQLLGACGLYYFGLEYASLNNQSAVFWTTSLLSLPLGVWLGIVAINTLPSRIKEGVIYYRNNWQKFRGPRNINLIIFILLFIGFSLTILSFYARFSWDMEHALQKNLMQNRYSVIFLLTTIVLGLGNALWVLVAASELIWSFRYEKQTGAMLYYTTKEAQSPRWSLVVMAIVLLIVAIVIFYRLFTI